MNATLHNGGLAATAALMTLCSVPGAELTTPDSRPASMQWSFQHDDQGRLTRLSDPGGQETILEYELHPGQPQRLKTLTRRFDGGAVVYEFDSDGQLIRMTDRLVVVSYGYDDLGRLNRVARQGSHVIAYTHDTLDRITSVQVGDFYRVDYEYDFLGRLATMNTPAGKVTYEYQTGSGQVIRSLPNGVKTFWKRQPNGELEDITHGLFKNPNDNTYSVLAQYTYEHGPDGRITAIRERSPQADFVKRYAYDTMGRLVRATGAAGQVHSYTYDAVGNRTSATAPGTPDQTCTYDWAGRLTTVNGQPCAYDASGNLTELTLGGQTRTYRYHPDGRLAEAKAGANSVEYRYDGFGHLVFRKATTGDVRFVPDPLSTFWQPLVIEESGSARTLVIWDGSAPLALVRDQGIEWLLHDHLGSVRAVIDARGALLRNAEYEPFGVGDGRVSRGEFAFGFAGLFWDSGAGLLLTLDRGYAPQLGSFLQPDPLKSVPITPQTEASLYQYCRANPICFVDARGQASEWYDQPGASSSPNFFSAYHADRHRSVAEQLDDDRLRAQALAGQQAYEKAQARGALASLGPPEYDPDRMTFFVRKFSLLNPGATIIPHTGVYFGRELDLDGLRLDGVELRIASVGGSEGLTVITPVRLQVSEPYGVVHLQPLETDQVRVRFENRVLPVRELPTAKKAEIQAEFLRRSLAEMGQTRGTYEWKGRGQANNCVDLALSLLDRSIQAAGLQFEGRNYRERFTTTLGSWSAADPTRFWGGLAAGIPHRTGAEDSVSSQLSDLSRSLSIGLTLDLSEGLPGRWGDTMADINFGYQVWDLVSSAREAFTYVHEHPGDPAGDLLVLGVGLNAWGLFGVAGSSVAAPFATTLGAGVTIGSGVRSYILQDRAERLMSFGGAVLPAGAYSHRQIGRHEGRFEAEGRGYAAVGGWRLAGERDGWWGRNPSSELWANTTVSDLLTADGARISGTFRRSEQRQQHGGSLFNLYEPTSVTVTRRSHDQYTISRTGGMIMTREQADRAPTPQFPTDKVELQPPRAVSSIEPLKPRDDYPPPFTRRGPRDLATSSGDWPGGGGGTGGPGRRDGGPFPSPVGGVYLGGAGGAIEGLGLLKGLRLDANGNLVLVAEEAGEIALPPFRLDDLVTVFRSVYLHREGPTVTIDPNPENPEKSAMIIRHSKATEDTYVGWVLYQADRLMKGYNQGVDNITTNDIASRVPGYADILETIYFGSTDPRRLQQEGIWERFWIVPAAANRFLGPGRELTLFDVPLKLKTQKMVWVKDKLVDDPDGESSPGAVAFTGWFTANYDDIAAEQYLVPPPETGIGNPVPVFAELQRIALMTAIAESLRDQGVPLPFWMRDHEVGKVVFERFTPGLEVTRTRREGNSIRSARIFGGVQLSPETQSVRTFATIAELAQAPPETRATAERTFKLAETLEAAVATSLPPAAATPLTVHRVAHEDGVFQAVALPGTHTLALNPCRLEEVDLIVPLAGGRDIRLTRHFNSFFNPSGPWGRGWTLDLPQLQEIRVPVAREGDAVRYTIAYELWTPLNSIHTRFKEVRAVTELGGSRLQVPDSDGPFHGLADGRPAFLRNVETRALYLKNGEVWHFNRQGELIAVVDGPQITVYERGAGRIPRIIGLLDGAVAAQIELEYDNRGRLAKAVGAASDRYSLPSIEVRYEYDSAGRVTGVSSIETRPTGDPSQRASITQELGTVGYTYQDSWVSSVTWTDPGAATMPVTLNNFTYNERGQVISETRGEREWRHTIAVAGQGTEARIADTQDDDAQVFTRFDTRMRPVEARAADGTQTAWSYEPDGSARMTVTTPDQRKTIVTDSASRRERTIEAEGGFKLVARFDSGGNLVNLAENDRVLLTQEWRPDGQLARTELESQAVTYNYTEHGLLSSIIRHAPQAGQRFTEWQETQFDRWGNPLEVKDHTGLHLHLGYDETGAVTAVVQKTEAGNLGYNVERDQAGRIQAIQSSWGEAAYRYRSDGTLERIATTRAGRAASVELEGGLVRRISAFDGGITEFEYHDAGGLAGSPRRVTSANGLILAHEYQPDNRLSAVRVGDERRVRLGYDENGRVASYAWEPLRSAP